MPYLPQTPDLCGGAAVAMVFRYWGDAHADVQQFAPLVNRKARGIVDRVLVEAVRARGWRAEAFTGSLDALTNQLTNRRPVIVLLHDRARQYHYVVVTSVDSSGVTIHDPSWGPSRVIRVDEFERRWKAARFWSLLILPNVEARPEIGRAPASHVEAPEAATPSVPPANTCDALFDAAVAEVVQSGLQDADAILGRVRNMCPSSAGPVRELAGVRFAEHRWREAATLAREALALDADDGYAIDVLGSSLFMLDDPIGALRAWNRLGKPRVDTVRIEGLHHTRYETVANAVAVQSNAVLTPEAFALAMRRVDALPDRSSARVTLRPEADGYAAIDAAFAERASVPRRPAAWAGAGLLAAVDREAAVSVPGFGGQGDVWSASWRWWDHRPRVAIGVAAPRVGGLPGVWRAEASWEQETFRVGSSESPALVSQSHVRGALAMSDWLTPNLRYSIGGGVDAWDSRLKAASLAASLERRFFRDRVALGADATGWVPFSGNRAFHAVSARVSTSVPARGDGARAWAYVTATGIDRVSDAAPLGLWPGAGDGRARTPLLRAHPLLDDGVVDITTKKAAFGRTLTYATAEVHRWLERPALVRVGIAAFADAAAARRGGLEGRGVSNLDVGGGLRLKLPMRERVLRIDVARGLADGSKALTFGWLF